MSKPAWVERWKRARQAGDWRLFPEQREGVLQLHSYHRGGDRFKLSGYEDVVAVLDVPSNDKAVWVQPDEYLSDPEN